MLGLAILPSAGRAAAAPSAVRRWETGAALASFGRIEDSSPTLADIDGDGKKEIIIGTTGRDRGPGLVVLEDNGAVKWTRALADPMFSAATVADISYPPDGIPEIIIS